MYEAVIFDMDGLLVDSEFVTYQAYKEICTKYKKPFDLVYYCTFLGRNAAYIESSLALHLADPEMASKVMKEVHKKVEWTFQHEGIPLKRGVIELITYLKEQGIKMGVSTSSHRKKATFILKKAGLYDFFEAMTCGDEVAVSKPDPEIFVSTGKSLDVAFNKIVVLEDSESGILGAHRAGMDCINIPDLKEPSKQIKEKAIFIAEDLMDVKAFFEECMKDCVDIKVNS